MTRTIYTSINPHMKRQVAGRDVSREYQHECLRSWMAAGFEVASLNNVDEASLVMAAHPDIRVIKIEGSRPKIIDFMNTICNEGSDVAGIANSDCILQCTREIKENIEIYASQGIVMFERLGFEESDLTARSISRGFDAFIFNTVYLKNMTMNENIMIGDTWWDNIYPLSYAGAGGKLFYVTAPMLLHLDHPMAWNDDNFVAGGLIANTMFGKGYEFSSKKRDTYDELAEFSVETFDKIKEMSSHISLRGTGLAARLNDRVAASARDVVWRQDDVARSAVELFRLSRPHHRRLGELLCTVANIMKGFGQRKLSDALFQIGDDLQFRAYHRGSNGEKPEVEI